MAIEWKDNEKKRKQDDDLGNEKKKKKDEENDKEGKEEEEEKADAEVKDKETEVDPIAQRPLPRALCEKSLAKSIAKL